MRIWRAAPLRNNALIGGRRSALGVAEEGADHAFLAAVLVAGAQGLVLAHAQPRPLPQPWAPQALAKTTAEAAQPGLATAPTRQVSFWHFASPLLRASSTVRKS